MTIVSRQIYSANVMQSSNQNIAKILRNFENNRKIYLRSKNLLSHNRSNLRSTFVSKLRRCLSLPQSNKIESMNHIEQVQIMRKTRQQSAAVAIFNQKLFPWILKVFEIFIAEHATEKKQNTRQKMHVVA